MTNESTAPVTNPIAYPTPFLATLNGQPVRILAFGNQEGKSPVLQYVGQDRKLRWESQHMFEAIDSGLLPPSLDAIQAAAAAGGGQGTTDQRTRR